jgi:hypothetical protein
LQFSTLQGFADFRALGALAWTVFFSAAVGDAETFFLEVGFELFAAGFLTVFFSIEVLLIGALAGSNALSEWVTLCIRGKSKKV